MKGEVVCDVMVFLLFCPLATCISAHISPVTAECMLACSMCIVCTARMDDETPDTGVHLAFCFSVMHKCSCKDD